MARHPAARRGALACANGCRCAFTLVEMLIAMVLTLILVYAIAEFYAIVGDSVKDGRATIELGGQVRAAVQRLKSDFDLITVTVAPWTDEGSASGYFEYFEGRGNDYDANGDSVVEATYDNSGNGIPDLIENGVTTSIGDGDDFVGFTIRSDGNPFTGRYTAPSGIITSLVSPATSTPVIKHSQLAEVVWWVGFDDLAGGTANQWDFNEPRYLYRRQLLIRPDLGILALSGGNNYYTSLSDAYSALMNFWQFNDISASIRGEFNGGTLVYRIRANSLSDLTKRENRFAHMPTQVTASGTNPPYLVDNLFPHSAVTMSSNTTYRLLLPCISAKSLNANSTNSYALQANNPSVNGESPGEDIMLSNLLAFDVQVYDPYARVWPDSPQNLTNASQTNPSVSVTALVPSDPGYSTAATNGSATTMLGLGAYVDLNYYSYLTAAAKTMDSTLNTNSLYPLPYFGQGPSSPSYLTSAQQTNYATYFGYTNVAPYIHGATYDTWALSYERDGVDQSGNGSYDLQTNGLDDDGLNGVDDVNERDTVPPYSQPLRGLQIKIRVYEPSTRQVRQATVATDFITE